MKDETLIIAIDGPSGAGKGTLARAVAAALRYAHVDTGAMYRAVAWKAVRDGMPLDDEARIADLAHGRLDSTRRTAESSSTGMTSRGRFGRQKSIRPPPRSRDCRASARCWWPVSVPR